MLVWGMMETHLFREANDIQRVKQLLVHGGIVIPEFSTKHAAISEDSGNYNTA